MSALRSHVSHSSLLRMDLSQANLGLRVWRRRKGVLIGWMCPEFPRWGWVMAWDRVSVKQHFGGKITVNVGDRGNQVRKTLGFLPLDLLS